MIIRYQLPILLALSLGAWGALWLALYLGVNLFDITASFIPPS